MRLSVGSIALLTGLLGACLDGTLSSTGAAESDDDGAAASDAATDGAPDSGLAGDVDGSRDADAGPSEGPEDSGLADASPSGDSGPADDAPTAQPDAPDVGDDPSGDDDAPSLPLDDALVVDAAFPWALHTGEYGRIYVTVQNTGVATWTQAAGYRLGAVGGSDPLFAGVVELDDAVIARGATHRFELFVIAPDSPGAYLSDWQMGRVGAGPFGDVAQATVDVVPDPALCPAPAPPPLDRFNARIHNDQGWKKTLDSTPLVWAEGGVYCAEIGYTDGRRRCPPRPEGHPEVAVCNEQVVGRALDTGAVGPTWVFNGLPCVAEATDGRCRNHPDNQFLVFVYGPGVARVCGRTGVCGEVVVP